MSARKSKKRKSRSIRMTDPVQSARFLEMAKKVGADESGDAFAKALDALVPKKGPGKPSG